MFEEKDINFTQLTDAEFEEMCFDILIDLGFVNLQWRRGGADNGRDIEGYKLDQNTLTGPYKEKWFFECKRYTNGVPPTDLNSKLAWADAEKPKHLVFFISSYITTGARTWLEKIEGEKFYKLHVIEEKELKQLLLKHPRINRAYFSSDLQRLVSETMRSWLLHNLIPEPELLRTLLENDDFDKFSINQLSFLWNCSKHRYQEIADNMEDSCSCYPGGLFRILANNSNSKESVLKISDSICLLNDVQGSSPFDVVYYKIFSAEISYLEGETEITALYSFVRDGEGEGLEVLVVNNSNFPCYIRHIPTNAKNELAKARAKLDCDWQYSY